MPKNKSMPQRNIPTTSVPQITGYAGICGLLLGIFLSHQLQLSPFYGLIFIILATGLPMWWLEFNRFQYPIKTSSSLLQRIRWRLRSFFVACAVWSLSLSLFQAAGHSATLSFLEAALHIWPFTLAAILIFFLKSENKNQYTLDALGKALVDKKPIGSLHFRLVRDQCVKAFFLPLMIDSSYVFFSRIDSYFDSYTKLSWFLFSMAFLYLIDTTFAAVGYLSTTHRLDAHIRSTDATWLGWCSALICYPPFFPWATLIGLTKYRDDYEWHHWLNHSGAIYYGWGAAIVLLTIIYVWATIVFGIRFSNLTNRGIITSGPFRYTKHPAYISKNISWWLISVPFISELGTQYAIVHCSALLFVNGIYWTRAKTEERHLNSDPTYQAYSQWIAKHGIFARIKNK